MNRHVTKKGSATAKYMKRYASSLVIREMEREAYFKQQDTSPHPTEWNKLERWIIPNVGR